MSFAESPTQMVQIPLAHLLTIRRALSAAGSTVKPSNAGIAAMKGAHAAYRLCFTPDEQAKVLEHVRKRVEEAPVGHYLHGAEPPADFTEAVARFGTSAIHDALGGDA